MKTLGLLGGMSWESTVTYYKEINERVAKSLGGLHSAKILLYSVDFAEVEEQQAEGDWAGSAELLGRAAKGLVAAGADAIVICTNKVYLCELFEKARIPAPASQLLFRSNEYTFGEISERLGAPFILKIPDGSFSVGMHKVADEVERAAGVPLLHISDATADALLAAGIRRTALLGTKYTMLQDFYKSRLLARGLDVLIPTPEDVEAVNRVIYEELCLGVIRDESRREFVRIIRDLKEKGAEAVVLGCTEIGLLVRQKDSSLPVFDTTILHAEKAAAFAVSD